MNDLDFQYKRILDYLIHRGEEKKDRTGTGTLSTFGWQIRHQMSEGFPLLTTKKMAWKTMVTELLWFLRGDTNIKFLVDNGCHIWDGDAYKNWFENGRTEFEKFADPMFMSEDSLGKEKFHKISKEWFIEQIKTDDEFAKKWGELGPVYGRLWRAFDEDANGGIDQIANLINDLKISPDSRRLLVTAWNPTYLPHQVLPPCHYGFQVYTRELTWVERYEYMYNTNVRAKDGFRPPLTPEMLQQYNIPTRAISLMWNQRSVDTFLGLPFNIASYGLLLTILAKEVNMVPDQLIGNLGDTHLYLNHVEQAKEQITREPFELPTLNSFPIYQGTKPGIECYVVSDFTLKDYQSHESIKAPLSN